MPVSRVVTALHLGLGEFSRVKDTKREREREREIGGARKGRASVEGRRRYAARYAADGEGKGRRAHTHNDVCNR